MVIRPFLLALIMASTFACEDSAVPNSELSVELIPTVESVVRNEGFLHFPDGQFYAVDNDEFTEQVEYLRSRLTAIGLSEFKSHQHISIQLELTKQLRYNKEAYELLIEKGNILLRSSSVEGINRAISSLEQLILININERESEFFLPLVLIQDSPRFEHRGLLLDCSRHFFSADVVKKYIDLLAFFKMNTLHWHLTEDQGWRIEIEKYPKLNEIASFRTEEDGTIYGGFYTKDEIREIVSYAQSRGIAVIPEIELPGHSQAAIAAYPHLSCTGKEVEVANDWGVFKEIYCAGNDSVFTFLEDVLIEVMELFPSKKIHIGGDEAPKTRWEECLKCQRRIAVEGLKDEHELQSYFIQRIQRFLKSHDRELIGWDEILEGGLAEGAIVQSWRGMEGGVEAVKHGHAAIMSPTSHSYFDYDLRSIDLKKVYHFDPIPDGLSPKEQELILGGECNLWSERVPDEDHLDSKVFPRILAMTEVLWSYPEERAFDEFSKRVQRYYTILKDMNVAYGEEAIPLTHEITLNEGTALLQLKPYSPDLQLYYSIAAEDEEETRLSYEKPIPIESNCVVNLSAERNGEAYGESIRLSFANHKAIDAEVEYPNAFSKWYTAGGDKGLVDSRLGGLDFRDGAWQGFWGNDGECTIDLGKIQNVNYVAANFYQYVNSWIIIPEALEVEVSTDGTQWTDFGKAYSLSKAETRGKFIERIEVKSDGFNARFIRVKAINYGKLPNWHEAAGMDAWVFMDEVVVQ